MSLARAGAQFAIYIVPGVATGLACALLLFGRGRVGIGARIYGGPPSRDGIAAWRVVAVQRSVGVEVPLRAASLQLTATDGTTRLVAQGVTDEQGAWEARLALGSQHSSVRVEVTTIGNPPRVVGLGQISLGLSAWQAAIKLDPLPAVGTASGELAISVSPARGVLAVPYPEDVVVQVRDRSNGELVPAAFVSVQGQGVLLERTDHLNTDDQGRAVLRLSAVEHEARLEISARTAAGQQGKWSGRIPVVPGAMWIEPAASRQGHVQLLSPVEHRQAYVTLFDRSSRLFSTRILLESDNGGARGAVDIPKPPPDSWILISQDPPGRETEVVAWPIAGDDGMPRASASLRTPLLVDGIPMAEKEVRRQSRRTRVRALSVLGVAALLEAVLLWWRTIQSRRESQASLVGQPDLGEALKQSIASGPVFWMRMAIATVLIALGFFSFALLSWIGTS